jgi:hypothetical protein
MMNEVGRQIKKREGWGETCRQDNGSPPALPQINRDQMPAEIAASEENEKCEKCLRAKNKKRKKNN